MAWRAVADGSVVYVDRGISRGMRYGIETARASGLAVEFRSLKKKAGAGAGLTSAVGRPAA